MSFLLQHWATEQAFRRPDARAVVCGDEALTYRQLDEAGNRLARLLVAGGCRRGDRVCLLLPKSPAAIVAILGVLKADAMYVPLDVASPVPRLARMIAAADTRWILAGGAAARVLGELFAEPRIGAHHVVGWLGGGPEPESPRPLFTPLDLAGQPATGPRTVNTERDPAHILFTSGSTGVPKGVVITHDSVEQFVQWAVPYFGTQPSDRISGHPPLHFDLSTFDIFGTFAAGAELHLVPPEISLLPGKLAEFIRASALTQWFSVPSVLNYMAKFDVVRPGDFPQLRRLLWCGEVFPTPSLIYWMERLPHVAFTNLYGPTEATIASSYYTLAERPAADDEAIPIGRPCAGEELLVLDGAMQPVAPGEVGDLWIGGVGLSPGYWRDPETTERAFVARPGGEPGERLYRTGDLATVGADGLVRFLGRADSQIKSRGYRIELGEIEVALHAAGVLKECAVVGVPTQDFEGTAIGCAYVPLPGSGVTPARLREIVARTLPGYMIPSRWWAFEELPKNANGKIDRRAIRESRAPQPAGAP